jgi:hypothetical protein
MRKVQFLPPAIRDFSGLDRNTQQRIVAALERFATTGHGNVKKADGISGSVSANGACSLTLMSLMP